MNFIVADRESVERGLIVRGAYVLISIRDPGKRQARIPKPIGLKDVLRLAFHDAEPVSNMVLPKTVKLMTTRQATDVWEFFRKWEEKVGVVVVHCEQGMSRSPAIAAALCQEYGGDPARFFRDHQPNQYVFRLMCDVGGGEKIR